MARPRNAPRAGSLRIPLRGGGTPFGYPGGDLGSGSEPQLAQDPGHVVVGRAPGDRKLRGDLAVGEPPRDEERDFSLASGEPFRSFVGRWLLFGHGDERGRLPLLFIRECVLYGLPQRHRLAPRPRHRESLLPQLRAPPAQVALEVGEREDYGGEVCAVSLLHAFHGSPQPSGSARLLPASGHARQRVEAVLDALHHPNAIGELQATLVNSIVYKAKPYKTLLRRRRATQRKGRLGKQRLPSSF